MERRTVLGIGVAGTLLLAAGGVATFAGRDATRDRAAVLAAVAPVVLEGALPADGPARGRALAGCLERVAATIGGLSPHAQGELDRLFSLLASPPGRRWLAGVTDDWPRADAAEVAAFLEAWRGHRLAAMRSAYGALHDLLLGAWYADPAAWDGIGYAGPLNA